jgi:hypothetical protein
MAMATNHTSGIVVLFGGQAGGKTATYFDDTWIWNGNDWRQTSTTPRPAPRMDAGLAEDAASRNLVVFGGFGYSGEMLDTWTWSRRVWTQSSSTGPDYPGGGLASIPRGALYLSNATWLFDATGWHGFSTLNEPDQRRAPAMAFDSKRGVVLAFGGIQAMKGPSAFLADSWLYDGTNWNRVG